MRLDNLLEFIGLDSTATVLASGVHCVPSGLAPAVRGVITDFAFLRVDGNEIAVVEMVAGARVATISRTLEIVGRACGCAALAFFNSLSRYMRTILLRKRIPFATADGQFYLPGSMLLTPPSDAETMVRQKLSPTGMASFAWFVINGNSANPQEIADSLGISKSSAVRACESLVASGVLFKQMVGPRNHKVEYSFSDEPSAIAKGVKMFGDPVLREFYIEKGKAEGLLLCGESALAERSLLVSPVVPVFAVSSEEAKRIEVFSVGGDLFPDAAKVKVLSYDPRLLSESGLVDPFTMTMTLDNPADERVALALDEVLGDCSWYEFLD